MSSVANSIAERLRSAQSSGVPISPISDELNASSVDDAYEIQRINTQFHLDAGRRISGRKVGLTSPAVQKQLGVDQPDFGMLWSDTEYQDGEEIPFDKLMQPKIECEIALILGKPLTMERPGFADVMRAVDYVVPAFEIVGSRIADWKINIYDTVADNASSGMYVLGGPARKIDDLDLRLCGMVVEHQGQPVSTGCGAACLGHPIHAAVWLAREMVKHDAPLQEGDVVLTGALGPMVNVNPGDRFSAKINGIGSVRASFSAAD